jgi:hypothetical protein
MRKQTLAFRLVVPFQLAHGYLEVIRKKRFDAKYGLRITLEARPVVERMTSE